MTAKQIQMDSAIKNDEISIKELIFKVRQWWKFLLSKWLVLFICGIIGSGLGFFYASSKVPLYIATTTFVLEDGKENSGLAGLEGVASIAGVDLGGNGGGIFQGDNILGLYKSRKILERTLLTQVDNQVGNKQLLIDIYLNFTGLRSRWVNNEKLINLKFGKRDIRKYEYLSSLNRLQDSVIGVVVTDLNTNYLSVTKPDKRLSVIQVDVKAPSEFFAKVFNDELVRNVNDFYITTKTKKTLLNVKILQSKADSVRNVMNGAISTAIEVADATPNLNPTRQVKRVAPAQRAQFSAETNKSILAEMVKNLELTKISLLRETPLIQLVDQPIYPLKIEKLSRLFTAILCGIVFVFIGVLFFSLKIILKNTLSE